MKKKTQNPYKILGVATDASHQLIKEAYRALAKKFHPDMPGGSADKFNEIKRARDVLMDEELRRQYDTTGKMPDSDQHMLDGHARTIIANMVQSIILQATPAQVETNDILGMMRQKLQEVISESERAAKEIGKKLDEMRDYRKVMEERMIGLVGKENIFLTTLTHLQAALTSQVLHHNEDVRVRTRAKEMLDDYTYNRRQEETVTRFVSFTTTAAGTGSW